VSACGSCACGVRPTTAEVAALGTATVTVFRYRPDGPAAPSYDTFEVPYGTQTSVVDALTWIKENRDPTLAFRASCRMGICGSCGLMVDGRPRLACETFLRDLGPSVRVAPLANFDVERDLVVDTEPFLEALRSVRPWLVPGEDAPDGSPGREGHRQTPAQQLDYQQFSQCINCLLCYAACPQVGFDRDFLGPAAIAAAMRYTRDSRDAGGGLRIQALDREDGVWPCTFVGACSAVCPQGVDPAAAVQMAKLVAAKAWAKEFVASHPEEDA